jgi:hypothetical protein
VTNHIWTFEEISRLIEWPYFFFDFFSGKRLAPSPDLSGRNPPIVFTGLATFPCFCVGTPFILFSRVFIFYYTT